MEAPTVAGHCARPFKRSVAIIFSKNCHTQCVPQHPANKRKPGAANKCPTEGSHRAARAKGICEDFSRVPSLFDYFLGTKSNDRTN